MNMAKLNGALIINVPANNRTATVEVRRLRAAPIKCEALITPPWGWRLPSIVAVPARAGFLDAGDPILIDGEPRRVLRVVAKNDWFVSYAVGRPRGL